RDFSDAQTNILEMVAGRLAADLERQTLVDEVLASRGAGEHPGSGATLPEPTQHMAPMIDGWQIAAHARQASPAGGAFFDWFSLDDGSLAVQCGDARERSTAGALTATSLRATARALAPERGRVSQLHEIANTVLWTGSCGNQTSGLF